MASETDDRFWGVGQMSGLVVRHLKWLDKQHFALSSLLLAMYSMLGRTVLVLISFPALMLMSPDQLVATDYEVPWYFPLMVAPVLETFLFQWAPISLAARLKQSLPVQMAVSTALFSLMHISSGLLAVLSAIPSGLVFAYAWIQWRKRGFPWAVAVTALTHFWVNSFVYVVRVFTE